MREDAAAEADLVRAGYRDRVLTELAQNAADAAGSAGRVAVWLDDRELHIANTGSPLNYQGVQALSALRASSKVGGVGQFGVGFSAVLSVSDEVEVRSTSGSIRFSAAETRKTLADKSIGAESVPVLRLVWPIAEKPAAGWDTEVVLRLRDDVDAATLLASMVIESIDLLLELPALESIRVSGDAVVRTERIRTERAMPDGVTEVSIGDRIWWQYSTPRARWLLPVVGGIGRPVAADVLRAPTRSDEELSLPAIVIASVDMQPDRRRVLPGARVDELASGYAKFAAAVPVVSRLALVPDPGFARSEVDSVLREAILRELQENSWLPVAGDNNAVPTSATVLPGLSVELAELLGDIVPNLVVPELSGNRHASALAQLDVHRIGLARVAEALSGIERPSEWWQRLYGALEPLAVDNVAAQELGALPVPLADGRLVTGPRTTVIATDLVATGDVPVHWARLVHPGAVHPLLERLGAKQAAALDLLSDPALQAAIEDSDDDLSELVEAVLTVAAHITDPDRLPSWLGLLPLPDDAGDLRSADELLLPDAPLATVLIDDSPFGTVDSGLVERFGGIALRAIGVGSGFTVVRDSMPTGADHDLDAEHDWWNALPEDPEDFAAVRDLDLVDDDRWPQALTLLANDPNIRPLLADRLGYTSWWLRRYARIDGHVLGSYCLPDVTAFAGLLDPLDHPDADALGGALADPAVLDGDVAQLLLDRLADVDRTPTPGVAVGVHAMLATAVRKGVLVPNDVAPPDRVRTLAGDLADPADAVVVDNPWVSRVVPQTIAVLGTIESAAALADLLDIRLASEAVRGEVRSHGRNATWGEVPGAVAAFVTMGLEVPSGMVTVHDDLTVRLSGAVSGDRSVSWWRDDDGLDHIAEDFR
ncbi:sacsin N-terminal ATP-binding-like domain-containing protein [Spelaeibacter cavernicola]|uniref:sacsin N-terminal ATP-binding-like domain-containing protein n=1 Tax=Antrihabitans cavernicola TaxID=2495913 RepID=UPI001F21E5F2|nr:ATP-binding protein [Spelaeibacter cavernicola]